MTIADIPRLPDTEIPRVKQLAAKLQSKELPFTALLDNVLAALGRFEIGAGGVSAGHGLAMGPEAIQVAAKIAEDGWGLFPKLIGKPFFINVERIGVFKVRMGFPPRISEALLSEADATHSPVLWLNLNVLPSLCQGLEGIIAEEDEEFWRFYRLEVLLDWLGGGWDGFTANIGAMVPFWALTTREFLEKIQKPLTSLVLDVLARCGV